MSYKFHDTNRRAYLQDRSAHDIAEVVYISRKRIARLQRFVEFGDRTIGSPYWGLQRWASGRIIPPRKSEVDVVVCRRTASASVVLRTSTQIRGLPIVNKVEELREERARIHHDVEFPNISEVQ